MRFHLTLTFSLLLFWFSLEHAQQRVYLLVLKNNCYRTIWLALMADSHKINVCWNSTENTFINSITCCARLLWHTNHKKNAKIERIVCTKKVDSVKRCTKHIFVYIKYKLILLFNRNACLCTLHRELNFAQFHWKLIMQFALFSHSFAFLIQLPFVLLCGAQALTCIHRANILSNFILIQC